MSSPTGIPTDVVKNAEESRKTQQALIAGKLNFSADGKAIIPSDIATEPATDPVVEPTTTKVDTVDAKKETKKKQPKQTKTVDDKTAPTDTKTVVDDKEETVVEHWKTRLKTLENMNKTTIKELQSKVQRLEEEKDINNNIIANLSKPKAVVEDQRPVVTEPVKPVDKIKVVSQDDIDQWGDEQYQFTRSVVHAEVSAGMSALDKRMSALETAIKSVDVVSNKVNQVVQSQESQATIKYNDKLYAACPDWQSFATNKGDHFSQFWTWAEKTIIPMTDISYQQQILAAHHNGNADVVAKIINSFKDMTGLGMIGEVSKDVSKPVITKPVNNGASEEDTMLEEQVVALDAGGDDVPVTNNAPEIRESEIEPFFADIIKGKYTEEQILTKKRQITEAYTNGTLIRDV